MLLVSLQLGPVKELAEPLSANSAAEPVWQAISNVVKGLSEVMLTSLPNFWRVSTSFMEGKFKKVNS
jgi:exocyst complex component 2